VGRVKTGSSFGPMTFPNASDLAENRIPLFGPITFPNASDLAENRIPLFGPML
jgi:hypothetical protein